MSALTTFETCERCKKLTHVFRIAKRNNQQLVCGFCIDDADVQEFPKRHGMSADEWSLKKAALLRYVELRPGYYNLERIKVALNMPPSAINHLLIDLRGQVVVEPMPFSNPTHYSSRRFYLIKDAPSVKALTNAPTPQAELSNSTKISATQEDDSMRTHQQILALAEEKLAEFVAEGAYFTQADFMRATRMSPSTFYDKKYEGVRERVKAAIAVIEEAQTPKPQATVETAEPDAEQLKAELRAAQQRNRELRQQLSQIVGQTNIVEVGIPLSWLQEQADSWRKTIAEYEKEMQQLCSDIESARTNLAAYERLIDLNFVEAPVITHNTLSIAINSHNAA